MAEFHRLMYMLTRKFPGKISFAVSINILNFVEIILTVTTSPPQSHLGKARRSRTNMQQSPHWLQWDAPNSPPKPVSYTHLTLPTNREV